MDARIRKARKRAHREDGAPERRLAGVGVAMRMAVEMVAALAVGVVIGLLLDRWLGAGPWFLIGFILLGACAGMLNVYRSALQLEQQLKRDAETREHD